MKKHLALSVVALVLGAGSAVTAVAANASPAVSVLSVQPAPALVHYTGGTVTVTAKVHNATSCQLELLSHPLFPVSWDRSPGKCKTTWTTYIRYGENPTAVKRAAAFEVVANHAHSRVFYVSIAPKAVPPPLAPPPAPVVTTTTTTTAPVVALGGGGGAAPPPNTAPSTTVAPSTTTTIAPQTTTTTVPATTTTTGAPTTTTTSPPVPVVAEAAGNWSGYEVDGGPFTDVSGTFTVPALTTDATCGEDTSEWVGVDGTTSSDLLQAGVDESEEYLDGTCVPVGEFVIVPWWEELPAPETVFTGFNINPGDTVSATLANSDGLWDVTLVDNTTGQEATESFISYSGPAQSAEWITEAPTSTGTGQEPLAPYCAPAPGTTTCISQAITYSNLAETGNVAQVDAITMVQDNVAVSTPSVVPSLADLLANGFTTTYTGP